MISLGLSQKFKLSGLKHQTSIFLLTVCALSSPALAQKATSLAGEWRITTNDRIENADTEINDSAWPIVELPSNVSPAAKGESVVWLRKRFNVARSESNLALVLGAVYDRDRVFLNGELIGEKMSEKYGYGRPRVYVLPANILRQGDNVLAIRLESSFDGFMGITTGPVSVDTIQQGEAIIWNRALESLIYCAIYISTGLFFIVLFIRVGSMKDYIYYSIFTICFALQQFMRNELRFQIADWFYVFKVMEQVLYVGVATAFFFFFLAFFKLKPHRLFFLYPIVNALVALTLPFLGSPVRMDMVMTTWFPVNLIIFGWYLYIAFRRAMSRETDAMILLGAMLFMMLITVHYFLRERGFIHFGGNLFDTGVLFFIFAVSFILIFRLIRLHLDVERRRTRLDSVNTLRDRVFRYIDSILRPPAQALVALTIAVRNSGTAERDRKELLGRLEGDLDNLTAEMDDILELSRLEVIQEPESFENVNFNDFITAVIPQGAITSYINVDPGIEIKTSLELVNSMVIRLIDFPGFKDFKHIDLIITSDLSGNIHFRFMLFHNDFKQTRKLHELITSLNPEKGSLWAKWAIVREIIRILQGSMTISIINRKFLRIDITLKAERPTESTRSNTDEIRIIPVGSFQVQTEGMPSVHAAAMPAHTDDTPRLSGKMSVGDFVKFVQYKLKKKG
ncbi:MAG: 7TM-DISM domain-containing protein [Leptospirales bacterium]|nr:7TM-DISM domain-containing protein [Leptospirales bacterium]